MANGRGIRRYVYLILDRLSAKKTGAEMEETLKFSGEKGGKDFFRAMKAQFNKEAAQTKLLLAKGLITPQEAAQRGAAAGRAYNAGLISGMDAARARGELTDREFVRLSRTLKNVETAGVGAFGRLRTSLAELWTGGFGQFLGAGGILLALRSANNAANELDASARVLAATAQITGTDFNFLQSTAAATNEQFRLGPVLANNFTIELTKLASKAGDLSLVSQGLAAFLDIGAARGLDAQRTLDAVRQALLGIDEGTDKLFGKNPSTLYKEYADSIGVAVAKLTDQEKAQAILNAALEDGEKVRGQYQEWLTTAAGQQFLLSQQMNMTSAALGKALQPAMVALLPVVSLLAKAFEWLIGLIQDIGRVITTQGLYWLSWFADGYALAARAVGQLLRAYAAWEDFRGRDTAAAWLRQQTKDINEHAQAIHNWADAAREVARETFGEIFNKPGAPTAGGFVLPPSTSAAGSGGGTGEDDPRHWAERGVFGQKEKPIRPWFSDSILVRDVGQQQNLAQEFASPWEEALGRIAQEVSAQEGIFDELGKAWAEGGIAGLGRFFAMKVKQNLAEAVEWGAKALGFLAFGNAPQASLAAKTAASHVAAAAAWRTAQAAVGGHGGGGGGGSASFGGAGNIAGSAADRAQPRNSIVLNITMDPLEPTNARLQRVIRGAQQYADERYGSDADGVQINVNGRRP